MSKNENLNKNDNPFLHRYAPNQRFISGAYTKQLLVHLNPTDFGESVTDKESYKLTLAGKRGAISSLMPGQQSGQYMFEDGKYDRSKDFSYILRKDLTIVDIDRYTERLKEELKTADESLVDSIQAQISALNDRKHMEEVLQSVKDDSISSKSE